MSPKGYTEDRLVEQPAIELFAELGWSRVSANEEGFGAAGTLGRETKSEVVLIPKLRAALERLNPALPVGTINSAVDELSRDRSAMNLAAANRDVCHWGHHWGQACTLDSAEKVRFRKSGKIISLTDAL